MEMKVEQQNVMTSRKFFSFFFCCSSAIAINNFAEKKTKRTTACGHRHTQELLLLSVTFIFSFSCLNIYLEKNLFRFFYTQNVNTTY